MHGRAPIVGNTPNNLQCRWDYGNQNGNDAVYEGYAPFGMGEDDFHWLIKFKEFDNKGRKISEKVAINASWTKRVNKDLYH